MGERVFDLFKSLKNQNKSSGKIMINNFHQFQNEPGRPYRFGKNCLAFEDEALTFCLILSIIRWPS